MEEEIPVQYRMAGETQWVVKNEAVMTLAKTKWSIRLKLCRQGQDHTYYSLHIASLTPDRVSRLQIKCQREGAEKPDWFQKYTFGGDQQVLVNPCLIPVKEYKEKLTFSVELRLLWDKEGPFQLGKEIHFPNADYALKVGEDQKLMVDHEYLRRRAPLLSALFTDEEKKESEVKVKDMSFQDLVDILGALQHKWQLDTPRLQDLIPKARRIGCDLWGPALNREFSEVFYRDEPILLGPLEDEAPETFEFNEPLTWTLEDVSNLQSSTSSPNQNVFLTSENSDRNCIIYVYTRDVGGVKYLSLGFQMSKASTSALEPLEADEQEEIDVVDLSGISRFFDIHMHLVTADGEKVFSDVIRRIPDEEYVMVGSPVFAKLEDVMRYKTIDDKLTIEFSWNENFEIRTSGDYYLPGIKNGKIVCEDTTIHINKELLSYHSGYFQGLFSDGFKESQMDTLSLPAEELGFLLKTLELIYTRRQNFDDVTYSMVLDTADRLCMNEVTKGLEHRLWSVTDIDINDRTWLAEQFMLPELKIKCAMEKTEEELKEKRASSRKRARPADFEDEPPVAPPQPTPQNAPMNPLEVLNAIERVFNGDNDSDNDNIYVDEEMEGIEHPQILQEASS